MPRFISPNSKAGRQLTAAKGTGSITVLTQSNETGRFDLRKAEIAEHNARIDAEKQRKKSLKVRASKSDIRK